MANVRVSEGGASRREHLPTAVPELAAAARRQMRGSPIRLTSAHAAIVLADLRSSATYRGWDLLAAAVMANHVHVVLGVREDPDPAALPGVLKAYASRALNEPMGRATSGTWWTQSGSRRRLPNEAAVVQAIRYVRAQRGALAVHGEAPEIRFG